MTPKINPLFAKRDCTSACQSEEWHCHLARLLTRWPTRSLVFGIVRFIFVVKLFISMPPQMTYALSHSNQCFFLKGVHWYIKVYFDPSNGNINGNNTPPTFWTTAEVSNGLLAACFPPLNPLIKRVPSPRKIYDYIKYSLASRLGRSEAPERLPSVENISKIHGSNEDKMQRAKGEEIEMGDYKRIEVERDAGFSRAVWSLSNCSPYWVYLDMSLPTKTRFSAVSYDSTRVFQFPTLISSVGLAHKTQPNIWSNVESAKTCYRTFIVRLVL